MAIESAEIAETFWVFSAFSASSAGQKLADELINTMGGDYRISMSVRMTRSPPVSKILNRSPVRNK